MALSAFCLSRITNHNDCMGLSGWEASWLHQQFLEAAPAFLDVHCGLVKYKFCHILQNVSLGIHFMFAYFHFAPLSDFHSSVGDSILLLSWFPLSGFLKPLISLIKPEDFSSCVLRVIQVHVGKPPMGCQVSLSEDWHLTGHSTRKVSLVECSTDACPQKVLASQWRSLGSH